MEVRAEGDVLTFNVLADGAYFDKNAADDFARACVSVLETTLRKPDSRPQITITKDSAATSLRSSPEDTPMTSPDLDPQDKVDREQLDQFVKIIAAIAEVSAEEIDARSTELVALGLDSIAAIRASRDAKAAGINASVRDVIDGRTCYGVLKRAGKVARGAAPKPAEKRVDNDAFELLPGQLFQLASTASSPKECGCYTFAWKSAAPLDQENVRAAWSQVIQNTPLVYRTLVSTDGAIQLSKDQQPTDVVLHDERDADHTAAARGLATALAKESNSPTHVQLHHLVFSEQNSSVLLLRISHVLYDAQSLALLVDRLLLALDGRVLPPSASPSDFISQARALSASSESKRYWKGCLSGAQPTLLGPKSLSSVATQSALTVPGVVPGIRARVKRLRDAKSPVGMPALLLAAWTKSIAEFTGQASPCIGLVHSGRSLDIAGLDQLQSPCMNQLPVHARDAAGQDLTTFAQKLQKQLDDRRDFEQIGLPELQELLGRNPRERLFDNVLNILWDTGSDDQRLTPISLGGETDFLNKSSPHVDVNKLMADSPYRHHGAIVLNADLAYNKDEDRIDAAFKFEDNILPAGRLHDLASSLTRILEQHFKSL